jgi:hypothetical protein
MSEKPAKPSVAASPAGSQSLTLGRREDIGLAGEGFYPDKKRRGLITVMLHTGFLKPDGSKQRIPKRTKTADRTTAKTLVTSVYMPELQRKWDDEHRKRHPEAANQVSLTLRTTEDYINHLLDGWAKLPSRRGTLSNYKSVARSFVRFSGALAQKERHEYSEGPCLKIRDEILATLDRSTGSQLQVMRNLRYVLREIGFPEALVELFHPGRRKKGEAKKKIYYISPLVRAAMWQNQHKTAWDQHGTFLLSANGGMNLVDVVFTLSEDFAEAQRALSNRERIKNGNPFRFRAWKRTIEWFEGRPCPKSPYLLWMFVFSADEIEKNPDVIYTRLSKQEEARRKRSATARARAAFAAFAATCGVAGETVTPRCFRNTNISGFESAGVPRQVGMAATGHTCEKNYVRYANATPSQMDSLAEITLDIYETPSNTFILTHTQSVSATAKNIQQSEDKIKAETAVQISAAEERVKAHTTTQVRKSEQRVLGRLEEFRNETLGILQAMGSAAGGAKIVVLVIERKCDHCSGRNGHSPRSHLRMSPITLGASTEPSGLLTWPDKPQEQ